MLFVVGITVIAGIAIASTIFFARKYIDIKRNREKK